MSSYFLFLEGKPGAPTYGKHYYAKIRNLYATEDSMYLQLKSPVEDTSRANDELLEVFMCVFKTQYKYCSFSPFCRLVLLARLRSRSGMLWRATS